MGKRQDIASEKKAYICGLLESGNLSQRQIAKNANVSHQTVMRIAKCMKENVPQFANKRSSCRGKRKTTPRTDRKIITTALENRRATTRVLVQRLKNDGVDISERTFRRRLYEANIRCRRPVKRPKLTPKMRKSRLEWAKAHSNLSIADWEKVIFSDETRLETVTETAQFVRRRSHEQFHQDCLVQSVKHPQAVMIWSCITIEGPGPLYFVNGTMNAKQYEDVIKKRLLPFYTSLGSQYTYMHDGAPCHRAKSIKTWLSSKNIPVLTWPGNSPDMNAIENVWSLLKRIAYESPSTTLSELETKITDIWENNEDIKHMIKQCIRSMPERIQAVIKAKGGNTRY